MPLRVGNRIWLPCRVELGPFSDERTVFISHQGSNWSGFVNVRWLKSGGEDDRDDVLATVVSVNDTTFMARIRGHALRNGLFEGRTERAVHRDSLQA